MKAKRETPAPDHIASLTHDPKNARKHTPRNVGTIVSALHEVGAARSIVIDEDGVVLAGNATLDAAAEAGITKLRVIETDGTELVAVKRTGLTPEQKTRLALYDNRAAELAEWDADVLQELAQENLLDGMMTEAEVQAITQAFDVAALDAPALSSDDRAPIQQMTFTVHDEQVETIKAALAKAKQDGHGQSSVNENSNGNALAWICERFNRG